MLSIRYRFDKVKQRAKLKTSVSRLVNILFPELEKHSSRYLRYALFNAAKFVCHWDSTFATYLAKKRAEGKHYNVAIFHAAKKLVRLIYAMEKSGRVYIPAV